MGAARLSLAVHGRAQLPWPDLPCSVTPGLVSQFSLFACGQISLFLGLGLFLQLHFQCPVPVLQAHTKKKFLFGFFCDPWVWGFFLVV